MGQRGEERGDLQSIAGIESNGDDVRCLLLLLLLLFPIVLRLENAR